MNCTACGGALALNSATCPYCGVLNAVDLIAIGRYRLVTHSALNCPNQCGQLQQLEMGKQFEIAALHCETCKGLHITRTMLNTLLLLVAKQVREINIERIVKVATEQVVQQKKQWRFCPVCRKSGGMQFNKFLAQMPVMIDECEDHGIWFDNGELRLVIEWAESGGMQALKRQLDANASKLTPPKPEQIVQPPQPYKPHQADGSWAWTFLGAAFAGWFFLAVFYIGCTDSKFPVVFKVASLILWLFCWWVSANASGIYLAADDHPMDSTAWRSSAAFCRSCSDVT